MALGARASRWWLAGSLRVLDAELRARGSRLVPGRGESGAVLLELAREIGAAAVHFTRGYEPFMPPLEARLHAALTNAGCWLPALRRPCLPRTGSGAEHIRRAVQGVHPILRSLPDQGTALAPVRRAKPFASA